MKRQKRDNEAYEIEALSKGISVFEALEDSLDNPVSVQRIIERTGFSRDIVDRCLKTWRLRGYVTQTSRGWMLTSKILRIAGRLEQTADAIL